MSDNILDPANNDQDVRPDPDKNYWQEYVGPGGKFHDPDEEKAKQKLAYAKAESDAYIRTLETKLDDIRADYLKAREEGASQASVAELVDQIKALQDKLTSNDELANEAVKPDFKPEQIEELVTQKFSEAEKKRKQEQNRSFVQDKLREAYGADYQRTLREQVTTLGLESEFVNDLASNHPQVLLKTLGIGEKPNQDLFDAPPRNERNMGNFKPGNSGKRTRSYYLKMRQTDPKAYHDEKTNIQMHKDMAHFGDEFFDTAE
jgi:hypothetical protein